LFTLHSSWPRKDFTFLTAFFSFKYCVLDLGSFASITALNERDTLKLKENYANDIVEERMCVVPKHCGLKLKMLSPAPRLKKTAHWLKGGEGVKLKLLLKGTHKSTRCASGELKQKNELFKELNRLSHNVQGTTSHCDIRLIGDVVFWLALTGYRLSLTPRYLTFPQH
jgi:hypothetical protein